uniref:Uncharacterized protein n=1 Tax=Heliothis virescens TaxID=7102 RepID=A0A2A4JD25_HELVI
MNLRHFSILITVIVVLPEQALLRFSFIVPKFTIPKVPEFQLPKMPEFQLPKMPEFQLPKMPEIHLPSMHEFKFPKIHEFSNPKSGEFSNGAGANWHPEYPKLTVKQYNIMKTLMKEEKLNKLLDTVYKGDKPIHPEENNFVTSKKEPILPKYEGKPMSKPKQEYSRVKEFKVKDIEEQLTDLAENVLDIIDALSDSDSDGEEDTEGSTDKPGSQDWDLPSVKFGRKNKKRGHKRKSNRLGKKVKKVSEALEDLFKDDDPDQQNNSTLSIEGNNLFDGDSLGNGTEVSTNEPISKDDEEFVITFNKKHKNGVNKSGHKRKNKHLGKKIKKLSKAIKDMLEDNDSKEQNNSTMHVEDDLSDSGSGEVDETEVSTNETESADAGGPVITISEKHNRRGRKKNKHLNKKIKKVTEAIENILENIDSGERKSTISYTDGDVFNGKNNVSYADAETYASSACNSICISFHLFILFLFLFYIAWETYRYLRNKKKITNINHA